MSKASQVVSEVVDHEICCGCGLCAGSCPFHNLKMAWRDNGDLAPVLLGECAPGCRLCLKVCPFGPAAKSEERLALARFGTSDDIKHDDDVGYYLQSLVGYSLSGGHRDRGASGGMATWLLETLLVGGYVDAVVCVGGGQDGERLFAYQILSEVESLRGAAGSRYYPVDLAEVIARIVKDKRDIRYAVVGLPCALKGLRLAMEVMPRLHRRIVYTLGLTCGHMPNRYYTEFLATLSGISPGLLTSAQYRLKEDTGHAGNYKFRALASNGRTGAALPVTSISNIWMDGYFQVNACNYCDDVFAEVADVCFMDAWLPRYIRDTRGHSLLVVRHSALLSIFLEGASSGSCRLETLPLSQVTESQRGVIAKKRKMLGARLFAANLHGRKTPSKRFPPDADQYRRSRRKVEAGFAIQQFSKTQWPQLGASRPVAYRLCLLWLAWPLKLERMAARVLRVLQHPALLLRLVRR